MAKDNDSRPRQSVNSGGFSRETVAGECRPASVDEVRQLLRAASNAAEPTRFSPISTGYNWGLGSDVPATAGSTVLKLDRLDKLRTLDTKNGYAIVEPGVTQAQLAQALTGTPWLLNCTASSQHTSVLGNLLDRGVGVRRTRVDDLLGLEVVLADGSLLRTGFWPGEPGRAPDRHPMGPSTLHLFTQSDLGVVTAAVVSLVPRQQSMKGIRVDFPENAFPDMLQALIDIRRAGLVTAVTKIFSPISGQAHGVGSRATYRTYMFVEGREEMVASAASCITTVLGTHRRDISVAVLDVGSDEVDMSEKALLRSFAGDPTYNDAVIRALFGVEAPLVDSGQSDSGWLFFLPLVPGTHDDLQEARSIIDEVAAEHDLTIGYTINLLPALHFDLVTYIRFSRSEQSTPAHRALRDLHARFRTRGFATYRTDIGNTVATLSPSRAHTADGRLVSAMKHLLDERGVIASGRYST